MINKILSRDEFADKPPILLDIGASGYLNREWEAIAKYSICVAFDGDDRDFEYLKRIQSLYRLLISVNKVVTTETGLKEFFLTKSPYCSSTLMPDKENLKNYAFAELFHIDRKIYVEAITLQEALVQNDIQYIDWYKTDTQGTDLRILQSLDNQIVQNTTLFELEPGIIDAYIGEDKFYEILEYFDKRKYIALEANIKGNMRANVELLKSFGVATNNLKLPVTPDWCEVTFFNPPNNNIDVRGYLLSYVFSYIKKQYGLCLEIAHKGQQKFNDNIFDEMIEHAVALLKEEPIQLSFKNKIRRKLHWIIDKSF
ncbi:MAG: FkbM family methyltransferase [Bacteroidetes bacterium]|nr:FkbM family methyltransferase [Bacteroidota bacterium]